MMRKRMIIALLALLLVVFLGGLADLFRLRFETGDIYPPYSSLRTDPLGAKGLFAGLERLRFTQVRRNYEPLAQIRPSSATTWLFLGTDFEEFQEEWVGGRKLLEALASHNGRLVIAFSPEHQPTGGRGVAPWRPPKPRRLDEFKKAPLSFEQAWGFSFGHEALPKVDDVFQPVTVTRREDGPLPEKFAWHTSLYFDNLTNDWKVVYARDKYPVIIERTLAGGALVLASDSYLFSNEALRTERSPALLAWFIGGNYAVTFDETHLGVTETPGIGTLLRRYRLHGVLAAFLVLAALFIWKNTSSLAPPTDANIIEGVVTGRDSTVGFINLLRRSVAPREILSICFEQWRSRVLRSAHLQAERVTRMDAVVKEEAAVLPTSRNPVAAYRRLAQIAAEKSFRVGKIGNQRL